MRIRNKVSFSWRSTLHQLHSQDLRFFAFKSFSFCLIQLSPCLLGMFSMFDLRSFFSNVPDLFLLCLAWRIYSTAFILLPKVNFQASNVIFLSLIQKGPKGSYWKKYFRGIIGSLFRVETNKGDCELLTGHYVICCINGW